MTPDFDPAERSAASYRLRELNDPLLWPLIETADETAREAAIEALVTGFANPLINGIMKRVRRAEPSLRQDDIQEIGSLVALRLIRKLRAAAIFEEHAILTLQSYVSRLAYNAWHDYRRMRYPERYRLKRSLRYVTTRDSGVLLWDMLETQVIGLSQWNGNPAGTVADAPARFTATPVMCDRSQPGAALRAILERIGHPVVFDALVDIVAELWNVHDAGTESGEFPADDRPNQLSALEQREFMEGLWLEIQTLPQNQRSALLLNLRDSAGSNALTLFLLLNVTDVGGIARALGLSEDELNELWDRLPLDDLTIAERLNLTRQQVINLRKAGRKRLGRRTATMK